MLARYPKSAEPDIELILQVTLIIRKDLVLAREVLSLVLRTLAG